MIQIELALLAISRAVDKFRASENKTSKLVIFVDPEVYGRIRRTVSLNGGPHLGAWIVEIVGASPPDYKDHSDLAFDCVEQYEWHEQKLWFWYDGIEPKIKPQSASFVPTPLLSELIARTDELERGLAEERAAFEKFKAKVGMVLRID